MILRDQLQIEIEFYKSKDGMIVYIICCGCVCIYTTTDFAWKLEGE